MKPTRMALLASVAGQTVVRPGGSPERTTRAAAVKARPLIVRASCRFCVPISLDGGFLGIQARAA
jgi:hypothetical protein